jgi:hypothetical protein
MFKIKRALAHIAAAVVPKSIESVEKAAARGDLQSEPQVF